MADDTQSDGVQVYDRPGSADRPPIWVFVVVILLILASVAVTYFLLT